MIQLHDFVINVIAAVGSRNGFCSAGNVLPPGKETTMEIREIFAPAFNRAGRVLSLMTIVDSEACIVLHDDLMARMCPSRIHPLEGVYVLANVTAEIMSLLDDEIQRKLGEDIPLLIDLALELIENRGHAAP
jgi:hypothetical protein